MATPLKQSTAETIEFGPFVDKTDGDTEETALSLVAADILVSKNHAALTAKNDATNPTGGTNAHYQVTLDATDTGTLGRLRVYCHKTGALAVWEDFEVIPANVYDALVAGTDTLNADVTQWLGTAAATPSVAGVPEVDVTHMAGGVQTVTDLKDFADAGYDPVTNKVQGVVLVDTTTTNTDMVGTDSAATAAALATLDTKVNDVQGATFSSATDSLEAIRNRGDAAWTTGAGGSDRLLLADTTIATLATQTSFTLTAGSADNDAYNNCTIVVEDVATSTQKAIGMVLDYVGASKTVTLKEALAFTIAATDKVYILAENSLKSTVANRQLDVTATGAAGIDWANVENPTTALDLAGTDIQLCDTVTALTGHTAQTGDGFARLGAPAGASVSADVAAVKVDTGTTIPALLPAALVGGRMDATVDGTGMETGAIDAILQRQMTEAYAADGVAPTLEQALILLISSLTEFAISGTTITAKKLDGITTAATFTLDDATNPTSRTRAT